MKKISASILVLAFLTFVNVFNAASQTISSAYFPIGGFDIITLNGLQTNTVTGHSIAYDSLQNIGFNTLFHVGFSEWHLQFASQSPSKMSSYFGADGYDPNANNQGALDHFYFGGKGVTPAAELRYFLACDWGNPLSGNAETEDTVFDAERIDLRAWINHHGTNGNLTPDENSAANSAWQTLTFNGSIPGPKLRLPDEWAIPPAANTTEVLRLEITDFVNVQSQVHSPLEYLRDDPTNSNKIFPDFIFRFDRSASGILYTLTITAEDGNGAPVNVGNGGQIIQSISYSDYTNPNNSNPANSKPSNNPATLFSFRKQSGLPTPNYAILLLRNNGTDGLNIQNAAKVDFALTSATSANQIPIIVRGFRVRSKMANDVLTGFMDEPASGQSVIDLHSLFHDIYYGKGSPHVDGMLDQDNQYHSIGQPAPIAKMPNIHAGGEPEFPNFRVIAYVDQLFRKYPAYMLRNFNDNRLGTPKNILPFIAENTGTVNVRFRSIYEDQAGANTPPAIIMSEGKWDSYTKGGPDGTPFVPRDGILKSIRLPSDGNTYNDLGFTLAPDPLTNQTLSDGYSNYTRNRQYRNDGTAGDHMCSAMAATPTGRVPTKWYALLPTPIVINHNTANWITDWSTNSAFASDVTGFRDSILSNGQMVNQNPINALPDLTSLASYTVAQTRASMAPEMRYDAWDAIAYGAKGIFFNEIGSEGNANIGICDANFRADYDSWLPKNTGDPKFGLLKVTLGDCSNKFMPYANFKHHLIKYVGSHALSDPNSHKINYAMGSTNWYPDQFQWIPIFDDDGTTPITDDVTVSPRTSIHSWLANPNHKYKLYEWSTGILHNGVSTDQGVTWSGEQLPGALTIDGDWVADIYPIYKNSYCNDNANYWAALSDNWPTNIVHSNDNSWYDNTNSKYYDAITSGIGDAYYPHVYWNTKAWLPTFYGFQERWNGAKQIAKDLGNCAYKLKDLQWRSTYSLPEVSLSNGSTNGAITVIKIVTGGSGYTSLSNTNVTLSGGGFTSAATISSIGVTGGVVTSITLATHGSGYTSAPTVNFPSGTGTPAYAVAIVGDGGAVSNEFNNVDHSPFVQNSITSFKMDRTAWPTSIRRTSDNTDPEASWQEFESFDFVNDVQLTGYADSPQDRTNDRRLYEIGFFGDQTIPYNQLKYVVLTNKRTWPYYVSNVGGTTHIKMNDPETTGDPLLGAIDVREFRAQIDPYKWTGFQNPYFQRFIVQDYRYCQPQIVWAHGNVNDATLKIRLDPGEGTLLSIQPYSAMYPFPNCIKLPNDPTVAPPPNNGRTISVMESSPTSKNFQMTYREHGGVAVCYPVEGVQAGDSSLALRNPGTPADSLIDSNTNCLHPVIAAHPEMPRQLALAYSQDSSGTGAHPDSTSVIFRYANYSTPYVYNTKIVLDKFKTVSNYTTATPAVTPAKTGCGKWWVSWRNPATGGHIALLDTSGNIISQKTFSAGDITTTRFVSITSHLWRDTSGASETDTCYMAFEEGPRQMGATIYFLKAYCNGSGSVDTSGLLNISAGLPYCENHYPNISMTATRGVMITWEAVMPHFTFSDSAFMLHRQHYAILHGRYPDGIRWTTYLSLKGFEAIVDHNIDDTLSMLPVATVADYDAARINDTVWNDRCRLVFNDPVNEQVHISHYGYMNGNFIPCFQNVAMPDASLWPSSPERKASNGVLQPLMYTHPTYAADTIYSPEVTIYDFPISTLINVPVLKQEIVAKPQMATCGLAVQGEVGQIVIHRDTNTYIQTWQQRDTVLRDTTIPPFNWADSSIHSHQFTIQAGDTLQYPRYFRVGQYDPGDTSEVTSYLSGSSDYVMMKVNMRSATNHAVLYTLDSCKLYSGGFMQSGSFADGGISKTGFTSSITGNVYLTFEVSRGNPANTFQVSNTEVYDDTSMIDYLPGPPGADTSFKKSPPHAPQTSAYVSQITMTVHPNPFRTQTSIELEVPKEVMMNVSVFDVLGRQVTNLFSNYSDHNNYNFTLDSKQLNPGMYYVRVQCGGEVVTRKIELLK
jgi:hypothetical protein